MLIPMRVNTPIIIKPTTGSPMITETSFVLSSHQGLASSLPVRAIARQLGLLLSSIFPALAPLCGMRKLGHDWRNPYRGAHKEFRHGRGYYGQDYADVLRLVPLLFRVAFHIDPFHDSR